MDFAQPYQTPDLAAVLQTLAACAPPRAPPQPQVEQQQQQQVEELEEGEYDPSEFVPIISPPHHLPPSDPPPTQPPPTTHIPPFPPPSNPRASPGPSTPSIQTLVEKASLITTYPPALRHTTRLLTSHPGTTARIRHLTHTAHDHERQWWTGRENLHRQLSSRAESRKKIDSVLASIGGNVCAAGEGNAEEDPVDVEKEVRAYDRKVHRAYREMVKATWKDLGKLGIPFFGINGDLVVKDVQEGECEVDKGKVGERELQELRGRMLGFLEDMVRE
ncbi:MAG: hypothetical protein L6R40_000772 [Gallowayella cf. fulva]|nr:MAG: hypothetical protein L6R40_000772 [Xanthomendoza cf. fulva]